MKVQTAKSNMLQGNPAADTSLFRLQTALVADVQFISS